MASGIYTILFIGSILFLARKKAEEEANFLSKIMGFFLLGAFNFTFNEVSLPLGFFVYILFFRPKLNADVKRLAAILGVLVFILTFWIFPQWENRPKSIEHELGSVYTMDFSAEDERIRQELKLEDKNWKLEDLEVEYAKDGRIID
ncbi:hypothetical protein [Mesobacillus jeotgali]|uniref:hypothetical protein n=1 Tax=Mesobacillus jeotgali TaxID=129985 RepID=UPI0009A591C3|nr:hypothetical protein [Mesobacillus jeotgali]